MYRYSEVIQALSGRVGFRQPTQAEYAGIFDPANTQADSGQYFDDFHSIVTVERLRNVVINEPGVSAADFNTYISDLKKSCVARVLDGIFGEVEVIEQNLEFDVCDHKPVNIPNAGSFVGRRVRVASDASKSTTINAITLFFDGPATFKLYLFNSVKKAPLKEIEVTTEADNQVIISPENWVLNYMDSGIKTGLFYIGYFQDDLGAVRAYDEQPSRWNCGKVYGSTCIEADRVLSQIDFNRYNPRISSQTFGLNIEYTSSNDFTERILRSKGLFDKAIGLQMAAMVVEKIVNSLRSNKDQRISDQQAARLYADLNQEMPTPEMPFSYGLRKQLRRELDRLHANFFPKAKPVSTTIPDQCYIPRYPL